MLLIRIPTSVQFLVIEATDYAILNGLMLRSEEVKSEQ